jgi:hypothetical protein
MSCFKDMSASYTSTSHTSPSQNTFVFNLEKKAKSSGGDKYVCETQPEFNIYVPQTISRENGKTHDILHITINPQ